MIRLTVMIFCLLAAPMALAERVYKWTDENGVVHYGSRPPANAQEVDSVDLKSAPPPPPPSGETSAQSSSAKVDTPPPEAVEVDPAVQGTQEFDQQIASQVKQENCRRARHNLEVLQVTPRVGQQQEDGSMEYVRLDDEQRAARMAEAQQQIDEFCNG